MILSAMSVQVFDLIFFAGDFELEILFFLRNLSQGLLKVFINLERDQGEYSTLFRQFDKFPSGAVGVVTLDGIQIFL